MQTHIIGKQIVELGLGPDQNAFEMQQEISWILKNQVMPRLEAMLDRMINPDLVIRLDQLEIDLGYVNPASLEREFTETLIRRFERILTEKLEQAVSSSGLSDVQGVPVQLNTLAAWRFFLEKGFHPWWAEEKDWQAWEQKIMAAMAKQPQSVIPGLKRLRIKQEHLIQRLIWQFSEDLLLSIVRSSRAEWVEVFPQMLRDLAKLSASWKNTALNRDESREFFWIIAMEYVLEELKEEQWEKQFVSNYLQYVSRKKGKAFREILQESCELALMESPAEKKLIPAYLEEILLHLWKEESRSNDPQKGLQEKSIAEKKQLRDTVEKTDEQNEEKKPDENTKRPDENTSLFVQNAGVVLLHPFLPSLFEELGYVKNAAFTDETSRHRAIHLIQYLANGKFEADEPDLSLNKLLCGLPLELPIERKIELTEEEKKEADHLLKTVISHWKALKNTSPDGLRVNYFIREGKLAFTAMGWKLQVEQKTQDIMLGRLPWGIGVIRMPWMPDMIRVEWN